MAKKRSVKRARASRKAKPLEPVKGSERESQILTDPHRTRSDARMLKMAVNRRWPRPKNVEAIVERLEGIVGKEFSEIVTKDGVISIDTPADSNAIRAAAVLVAMEAQNQKDDVVEREAANGVNHARFTITVEVEQQRDRLAAIAQRLGLGSVGQSVQSGAANVDPGSIVGSFESGTGRSDGNEAVRPT